MGVADRVPLTRYCSACLSSMRPEEHPCLSGFTASLVHSCDASKMSERFRMISLLTSYCNTIEDNN